MRYFLALSNLDLVNLNPDPQPWEQVREKTYTHPYFMFLKSSKFLYSETNLTFCMAAAWPPRPAGW